MQTKKHYILLTIVITLCLLAACSNDSVPDNPSPTLAQGAILQALTNTDLLFKQREDLDKLRAAIKTLSAVRDPNQRNYQVEWTFAKYNYFLGKQSDDEAESEKAFETGRDAAKIASRIEPQKPDGHLWYGANLGELSKKSPITIGLKSVGDIKEAMNKVIEIEPGYQGASAYDALAQVELATRLKGGSSEKAVEYLEKGLTLAPENTNIRLHLAEAYLAVKKDSEAKKQLDYLMQMKPDPEYLFEYRDSIAKAKKLLQTNF